MGRRRQREVKITDVRRFVALYEQGFTVPEIAEMTGRSLSTVHRWLLREGVQFRPRKGNPGPRGMVSVVCGRKFCADCGHWRHVVDFGAEHRDPLRLRPQCRACRRIAHRERIARDARYAADRREYARFLGEGRRRAAGVPERRWVTREAPRDPGGDRRSPRYLRRQVPVEPLLPHLHAFLRAWDAEHGQGGVTRLAMVAFVPERRIWGLVHREYPTTHYAVADRLATAMGLSLTLVYGEA